MLVYQRLTVAITTMATMAVQTHFSSEDATGHSPPQGRRGVARESTVISYKRGISISTVHHIISYLIYLQIYIYKYTYVYIYIYIYTYVYIYISIYPWYMDVYGVSAWNYHQTQHNSTIMFLSGMPHMFSWDLLAFLMGYLGIISYPQEDMHLTNYDE